MVVVETEISIDENDHWWNGNMKIENNGVVKFFKMNLHKDQRYFIYLKHSDKEEKGYLKKVLGFPLLTINIEDDKNFVLSLDNEKKTKVKEIYYDSSKNVYWSLWEDEEYQTFIPYKITFRILQFFSSYIQQDFDSVFEHYYLLYNQNKIPILEKEYNPEIF
ncbi:MAG: hypothetical protein ACK4UJ_08360 [Leptonema sp. (in: bacteria)]